MANLVYSKLYNSASPNLSNVFLSPDCPGDISDALNTYPRSYSLSMPTTTPLFAGWSRLRVEVRDSGTSSPCGDPNWRVEPYYYPYLEQPPGEFNEVWWYGIAYLIDSTWPSDGNGNVMIAQLKKHGNGLSECAFYASVSSGGQNVTITVHGGAEVNNQFDEDRDLGSFTLPRGVWTFLVIKHHRMINSGGEITIWRSIGGAYSRVFQYFGATAYYGPEFGKAQEHRHKCGIYYSTNPRGTDIPMVVSHAGMKIARASPSEPDQNGFDLVSFSGGGSAPSFSVDAGGFLHWRSWRSGAANLNGDRIMSDVSWNVYRETHPLLSEVYTDTPQKNLSNLLKVSGAINVINSNTFSRAGGWTGFIVGERLFTSGFASNNQNRGLPRIVSISGTSLVTNATLINETGSGDEVVQNYPSGLDYDPTKDPNWNPNAGTTAQIDATYELGRPIFWASLDYGVDITNNGIEVVTWGDAGTANRYMSWNVGAAPLGGWIDIGLADRPSAGTAYIYHGSGTGDQTTEIVDTDFDDGSASIVTYPVQSDGTRPLLQLQLSGDWDGVIQFLQFRRIELPIDGDTATTVNIDTSDTGLSPGTQYYYSARVVDEAGNETWAFASAATEGASQLDPVIFTPGGGTVESGTTVALTSLQSPDAIYYRLDSQLPSEGVGGGTLLYSAPIEITEDTDISAIAVKDGFVTSQKVTQSYVVSVTETTPTPTASPNGGTFTTTVTPTLASLGADSIFYTLNGVLPTDSDTDYLVAPIPAQSATFRLRAFARTAGKVDSGYLDVTFTKITLQVGIPVISPSAGTYQEAVTVTAQSSTSAVDHVYVTLDETTPSAVNYDHDLTAAPWSFIIDGSVTGYKNYVVKAIAVKAGYTNSFVATSGTITVIQASENPDPPTSGSTTATLDNPPPEFLIDVSIDPITGLSWTDDSLLGGDSLSYEWQNAAVGEIDESKTTISANGQLRLVAKFLYLGPITPNIRIISNSGNEVDMRGGDGFPEVWDDLREAWTVNVTNVDRIQR